MFFPNDILQKENLETDMPESLKAKHEVIISELKAQLNDLESFAYKQVSSSWAKKKAKNMAHVACRRYCYVDQERLSRLFVAVHFLI